MLIGIAGLLSLVVALLFQFLGHDPKMAGLALLVAFAICSVNLVRSLRLARDIGRLGDSFEPSRTHAANLDRQLDLRSPVLARTRDNLNSFVSGLQSGIGSVRCASIRIAAVVATITSQLRRIVAIAAAQREQTASIVLASGAVAKAVDATSRSSVAITEAAERNAREAELASEDELEGADTMGEPAVRITTEVDVTPWVATKRAAMAAHASQISEESFFLSMPEDVFAEVWGQEWFIRVRPEPVDLGDGAREPGLVLDRSGAVLGGGTSREGAAG